MHWNMALLSLLLLPLIVLAFMQNCSPMKALRDSSNVNSLDTPATDICDARFKPNVTLFLGKVTKANPPTLFEQNKNQLESADVAHKVGSYKGQVIHVSIDMHCTPAEGSLSAAVLAQNTAAVPLDLSRRAFPYTVPDDATSADLGEQADADPCVVGLTPFGRIRASSVASLLNDPQLSQQFYLGSDFENVYNYFIKKQNTSAKVKIGFIDTGADCTHSDLVANLVSGCGFDAVSGVLPSDNDGHGSHTMGLTGAVMNNGIGITGMVGNAVELHAIRVIDVDQGTVDTTAAGIQHAIDDHLDVINISLESDGRLPLVDQAVQDAVNAGIVVVMAAGNSGEQLGVDIQVSPAMMGKTLQGAITVGSIDAVNSVMSDFSNYGSNVEIFAVGAYNSHLSGSGSGGLLSLDKDGGYHRLMGTSQATPLITAAAGLAVQFLKQHGVAYTPADIERIVEASTDKTAGVSSGGGAGVINTSKLVRSTYSFAGQGLCGD